MDCVHGRALPDALTLSCPEIWQLPHHGQDRCHAPGLVPNWKLGNRIIMNRLVTGHQDPGIGEDGVLMLEVLYGTLAAKAGMKGTYRHAQALLNPEFAMTGIAHC